MLKVIFKATLKRKVGAKFWKWVNVVKATRAQSNLHETESKMEMQDELYKM